MAKFFITGGGTGGHIYPAIAVADALVKGGDEVLYVGNPNNLEYNIVGQKGYKFLPVNVKGMPRKLSLALLKWLFQLDAAVIKCCYYILKYKPDVVFGTGGYVSAPALIAAKLLNVPYMIHDCDAQPGLVSRKLAPYAKSVSVAFESAINILNNSNCKVNGNPIRSEFKTLSKKDARLELGIDDKLTLCIMGGSQGARSINDSAVRILEKLSKEFDLQIIFQTGKKNFDKVIEDLIKIYPNYESDKNLIIRPYFDNMVTVLKASDIAVSRSGSLSIFEICASGIAPIYVPYPYAAADHQRKNAKYMVERGAGVYIDDTEINDNILFESLKDLIVNPVKLKNLQEKSVSLAHYDGTEKIIEQLKKLV